MQFYIIIIISIIIIVVVVIVVATAVLVVRGSIIIGSYSCALTNAWEVVCLFFLCQVK